MGNLVLAVAWLALRHAPRADAREPVPATTRTIAPAAAAGPVVASAAPAAGLPWLRIASDDYRQYIANLRGVNCPEWLIRDLTAADVDALYEQKFRPAAATRFERRREKRAFVQTLLGYEWENYGEEVWKQDLPESLTLGFLPDEKATEVLALKDEFTAAAQKIRTEANFILIDDDRARLQSVQADFAAQLARLLDPAELEEFQLRGQQVFLTANDIHFDGVTISSEELRELVGLSISVKDMARNEFVADRPLPATVAAERQAAFEAGVKNLLGAQRYTDYQRAQDVCFRETLAFSRENNLPQSAAVAVYESRQNAAGQAAEIQKDGSLAPEEQATALAVLKAATMNNVAAALGGSYQNYLQGPGQWLAALTQPPETPAETQAQ